MLQWAPLAISAVQTAAKLGLRALTKPKKEQPDTKAVDKYAAHIKSNISDSTSRNLAERFVSNQAGALYARSKADMETNNRLTGLSGSGLEAEQSLQMTQDAIKNTNEAMAPINANEQQRVSNLQDKLAEVALMRDRIIQDVKKRNRMTQDEYKQGITSDIYSGAIDLASTGVNMANTSAAANKALTQQFNSMKETGQLPEGITTVEQFAEFNKKFGTNAGAVIADKVSHQNFTKLGSIYQSIPGAPELIALVNSGQMDIKTGTDKLNTLVSQHVKDMNTPIATLQTRDDQGRIITKNVYRQPGINPREDTNIEDNPTSIKSVSAPPVEKPGSMPKHTVTLPGGQSQIYQMDETGKWQPMGEPIGDAVSTESVIKGNKRVTYKVNRTTGEKTLVSESEIKDSVVKVEGQDFMNKPQAEFKSSDWTKALNAANKSHSKSEIEVTMPSPVIYKTAKALEKPKDEKVSLSIVRDASDKIIGLKWKTGPAKGKLLTDEEFNTIKFGNSNNTFLLSFPGNEGE